MSAMFGMRFDFRNPSMAGTTAAERYEAAIEMAEWGDRIGCVAVTLSEHHGADDGYVPSPLPVIAAMAARTENVRFMVAALIAPFYDPIRLAEDLVVLDHLTRGRLDLIVAGGYVREEFEHFGVPMNERGARVTETISTLKAAFTGEPFEFRGRTVRVTPAPYRPGGPSLMLGGSSEAAARRAARIADGFLPSVPEVWDFYRDEMQQLGKGDPGPSPIGKNRTVALADDVERGWEQMGPYFLHETNAYGAWAHHNLADNAGASDNGGSPYRERHDVDELRASGDYVILTPDEMVAELKESGFPFAMFHPLCGGMPIEVAWSSLRLFEHEVMPAFAG